MSQVFTSCWATLLNALEHVGESQAAEGKLLHECKAKPLRLGSAPISTSRIWGRAQPKQVLLRSIAEGLAETAGSLLDLACDDVGLLYAGCWAQSCCTSMWPSVWVAGRSLKSGPALWARRLGSSLHQSCWTASSWTVCQRQSCPGTLGS